MTRNIKSCTKTAVTVNKPKSKTVSSAVRSVQPVGTGNRKQNKKKGTRATHVSEQFVWTCNLCQQVFRYHNKKSLACARLRHIKKEHPNTPRKPKQFMLVSHAQLLKSRMRAEAFQKVSELGHVTNAGRGWRTCRATNSKLAAMLMSYGAMVSPKLNSKSFTTTVLSGEESMHSLSNQMQRKRSNATTA